MEYFVIFILQVSGIGFHVGQTLLALDDKFPDDSFGDVWREFIKRDKITLFISAWILFLCLTVHFIVNYYFPSVRNTSLAFPWLGGLTIPYLAIAFMISFILGYAGQALFYKWLGKAKKYLEEKADKIQ